MAPIANSGRVGTPSLRTTITSSGAVEGFGNLRGHWHATAWQCQHDGSDEVDLGELDAEYHACRLAVVELEPVHVTP